VLGFQKNGGRWTRDGYMKLAEDRKREAKFFFSRGG